jgi:hypothetical protein
MRTTLIRLAAAAAVLGAGATALAPASAAQAAPRPAAIADLLCGYQVSWEGGGGLNVRTNPSLSAPIKRTLPAGSLLVASKWHTAQGDGLTWRKVYVDGEGWAADRWLIERPDIACIPKA